MRKQDTKRKRLSVEKKGQVIREISQRVTSGLWREGFVEKKFIEARMQE